MTISSEEAESDEQINQAPNKKGVFARIVRENKEEKKKQTENEPPQKTPKITILHKQKPKADEQSEPEAKRRTEKKIPKELYDKLEVRKLHAQTLDRQIKELESNIQLVGDKESVKLDEENVNTDPPASTPPITTKLASESNFGTEDTQNPLESNVHDEEVDIVKDKDTEDKVSNDAPKVSEAPSGEATGA
ncbi:uncharacterized protein LOC131876485 [Cryptomeria japonica]|uniref:uncharacterized protein LOC131876485 n=1 Tax=Cryptomeria japonica TaxID=3369 RepID=UPI0027DA4622|nr:uncharacterized protein LOC131876485 [Cryptomeria japonica]